MSVELTRISGDQLAIFRAQDFVMSSYYDDSGALERTFMTLHSVELKDTRAESKDVFRHSFVRSHNNGVISSEQPLISIRYVRRHRGSMSSEMKEMKPHPVESDLIQDGTEHRPSSFKKFKPNLIPELWTVCVRSVRARSAREFQSNHFILLSREYHFKHSKLTRITHL